MKLLIIFIAFFLILTNFSHSEILNEYNSQNLYSDSRESFDFSKELKNSVKKDSVNSAIANYCLLFEKDSVGKLLFYEKIKPLSIEKQIECKSYSISVKINLEAGKIFSNKEFMQNGFCMKTCTGSKEACTKRGNICKTNISENLNIYDHINDFSINSCLKETEISYLVDKHIPIKWDLRISCEREKIPVVGNSYIYISGICTEEQLKKIQNRN